MGSVFRAVEAGFVRIGIVDGLFGNAPSVWHKEILYAISARVEVVGAGSMGALRAAELAAFGMIGIGRIFRLFRSGLWTDDDEVAVIHAGEELDHCPVSEAMVNVRFTLRKLRRAGAIDRGTESELVRRMKTRHFSERTREALAEDARLLLGRSAAARFTHRFEREYVDMKKVDAKALIAHMRRRRRPASAVTTRCFSSTGHWREQFERHLADVPPLR